MTKKHCEKFLWKNSLKYLETKLKKSGIRVTGQRTMNLGWFFSSNQVFLFFFFAFSFIETLFLRVGDGLSKQFSIPIDDKK